LRPPSFLFCSALAAAFLLAAVPVFAHHSFTAEFDVEKPVTFTGTVTGINYVNPHVQIYLDSMGPDGKVVKWHIESGPPNQWHRGGLRKVMLSNGTVVKIRAYAAKDGTQHFAFLRDLTFMSGPDNGKHYELWIGGLDEQGRPIYSERPQQ
jgi:hypothetical protein